MAPVVTVCEAAAAADQTHLHLVHAWSAHAKKSMMGRPYCRQCQRCWRLARAFRRRCHYHRRRWHCCSSPSWRQKNEVASRAGIAIVLGRGLLAKRNGLSMHRPPARLDFSTAKMRRSAAAEQRTRDGRPSKSIKAKRVTHQTQPKTGYCQ